MAHRRWRSAIVVAALAAAVPMLTYGTAAATTPSHGGRLTIETVSNPRPELVSGGQVLIRVAASARNHAKRITVSANGRDVTSGLHKRSDGSLLGLVSGLREGRNTLEARQSGSRSTTLRVTNHPITGPVLSGSQQLPFYCETQAYGLPAAEQPHCSAPTQVVYQYRTTAGAFAPLPDPSTRPADLATATVNGEQVPYIVRVERGTIDRAVYEIAALYDGSAPSPVTPDGGWNDKLVYTFGGGCNSGFHQGRGTGGVMNDLFLGQGYAVASSSLNVLDNNCSPIISAEAAMMVKEHFVETYGPVEHTIGWGGSGGAIQQYDIAESYPGILDGIIPGVSFPDPLSTAGPVSDCRLLNRFFAGPGASFTTAQKTAIGGFLTYSTCVSWDVTFASRSTATESCNAAIPVSVRWDPVTNPNGVKCNSTEQLVNQIGRDPKTGFVRSPLDNTGVQYGLAALKAGTITPAQFTALNAGVGGMDHTGKPVPQRTVADPKALNAVYANDIVNSASQGLRQTPIIDQRTDLDLAGLGNDIHTTEWSFVMRQRLLRAGGTAGNQVIIASAPTPAETAAAARYELDAMDRWLSAIGADRSGRDMRHKVLANRPADLGDGCYLSATQRIRETLTYPSGGQCGARFPVGANTRMAAGERLSMDVMKCTLKPLDFRDYPVTFTAAERAQLRATFAKGVCDYGRPGVGQRKPIGTWLSYGDERTGTTPPTRLPGSPHRH
ncbi:DUF6351 family protein [Actinomadura sp. HBU206391]|uniref:DUF6351 family protein n=1 Tax=Actinomadura sp. HBU206391 TaxID=2731692 RepID=UPI0016505A90|nr:DUF6351 family protein [Actinomadura sp. HBU206391]MBC6457394.1 hypothetical protein [Actinomadura sp. HBU206391]